MTEDSSVVILEGNPFADSNSQNFVNNPITIPSTSSTSSMTDEESNAGHELDLANRPLGELLALERVETPSCILIPVHRGTFHFRLGMLSMLPTFNGLEGEKAYIHLHEFEQVCNTLSDQTCPRDIIRLMLFPFTLKNKAKPWLLSLRPNSITS